MGRFSFFNSTQGAAVQHVLCLVFFAALSFALIATTQHNTSLHLRANMSLYMKQGTGGRREPRARFSETCGATCLAWTDLSVSGAATKGRGLP